MLGDLYEKALEIQQEKVLGLQKDEKDYAFTFIYPPSQVLYSLEHDDFLKTDVEVANLYIHIPYCTGRCNYCYFGAYSLSECTVKKADYVDYLIKQMKMIRKQYGKIKVLSIHFGGGTPTVLSEEEFEKIFVALRDNFNLEMCPEITCESSPETLTESKLKTLMKCGVNRLNIGVQTLNDKLLASINRRHDSSKAIEAITMAQNMGLKNINVDLMYGLQGQTMEDWEDTVERILKLKLQSVSTYRLRIHPKGKINDQVKQFNEQNVIKMYIRMLELMKENDYYQCSSHKFAIKEELVQKQIVNKRGIGNDTLIPLGMAAYGYIGNTVFWNERKMEDYVAKLDQGKWPYSIGYELNKTEEMAKVSVLGIHNIHGINLEKFREKFQVDLQDVYPELVEELLKWKLITISDSYLRPSLLGMVFADEIAVKFYSKDVMNELEKKHCKYGIFFDEILD